MVWLSGLVDATSLIFGVEKPSVVLLARNLRQGKLIVQKGRGLSAAHMGPSDATNLMLAIWASPTIKDARTSVQWAREAQFHVGKNIHAEGILPGPPPFRFMKNEDGSTRAFGDALDALVDEMVRYGDPHDDAGDVIRNLMIEVTRPGRTVKITLDSGGPIYSAEYWRDHPCLDGLSGAAREDERRRIYRVDQPHTAMELTARVTYDAIGAVADVLRGSEPEEGEAISPPYDPQRDPE